MAFPANDGSMHHSAGRASLHNRMSEEKGMSKPKAQPKAEGGGEEGEDISSMPIHEAVTKHGSASEVHITHEDGKHHKHSVHGGKHHHSDHESAAEAHMHGAIAGGGADEEDEETPDNEEAEEEENEQPPSSSIPGMA